VEFLNSRQESFKGLGIYNTDFEVALARIVWHRKETVGMGVLETALALHAALGIDIPERLREECGTHVNFFSNGSRNFNSSGVPVPIQKIPRHGICYLRGIIADHNKFRFKTNMPGFHFSSIAYTKTGSKAARAYNLLAMRHASSSIIMLNHSPYFCTRSSLQEMDYQCST